MPYQKNAGGKWAHIKDVKVDPLRTSEVCSIFPEAGGRDTCLLATSQDLNSVALLVPLRSVQFSSVSAAHT